MLRQRRGYSLIELAVVLGVMALLGAATLPTFSNSNSRGLLDSTANQIKQALVDARVRSLAPNKNDGPQTAQVYQVAFTRLPAGTVTANTATGDINTNTISLQRGLAQCGQNASQGGFATVRSFKTPRGIYLASFYPYAPSPADSGALVRFTVGQLGFDCGSSVDPTISSTSFGSNAAWTGSDNSRARYLVLQLATSRGTDKRFIAVDRLTSEVTVSRTNPQLTFQPVTDTLAPRWDNTAAPSNQMIVSCNAASGETAISLSFYRAKDRYNAADLTAVDGTRLVYYDVNWQLNFPSQSAQYQPLAIKYFYDLTQGTVRYDFTTTAVSAANQPSSIDIRVVASDELGRAQPQNTDATNPTTGDIWRSVSITKPTSGWCSSSTGVGPGAGGSTVISGGTSEGLSEESGIVVPPHGPSGG
jgi:prepilin-type N-terminal cleavage/methylation domain-containing protein